MLLVLGVLVYPMPVRAQESVVTFPFTTASYRHQFDSALIAWSILSNLKSPLRDTDDEYDFQSAFWPMELTLYQTPYVRERLSFAFSHILSRSTYFQQRLLEVVYTNWPGNFSESVAQLMRATDSPRVFAMCAEYLWRGGRFEKEKGVIRALMKRKFDTVRTNPVLMMLRARLEEKPPGPLPPLSDLFSEQFAPGLTVTYSFQRKDRDYPGLVIVRRPDGHFVRDSAGGVFSVPQLARSITDLPFYLTNGNTPQGVYRMSGFAVSSSRFIGPTPNIQLSMPYEIPLDSFLVSPTPGDTLWSINGYRMLLPSSWQTFQPVYEAYYAGQAGRTAIIAHGTTINQDYYRGQPYFPQTPSQGCLCTHESWSPLTGIRLESDQQKLVNAVHSAGNGTGYTVVIELGNGDTPVRLREVLPAIRLAEKQL